MPRRCNRVDYAAIGLSRNTINSARYNGARRRIRTTDTRIFNPRACPELTRRYGENRPQTEQERKKNLENSIQRPARRGVTIHQADANGFYWHSDELNAGDHAATLDEARAQIDAAMEGQE